MLGTWRAVGCLAAGVVAGLVSGVPAHAQGNEAEKMYRPFEKKLADARAFKVTCHSKGVDPQNRTWEIKGELTVASANKLRWSLDGTDKNGPVKVLVVSDGKTMGFKEGTDRVSLTEDETPE